MSEDSISFYKETIAELRRELSDVRAKASQDLGRLKNIRRERDELAQQLGELAEKVELMAAEHDEQLQTIEAEYTEQLQAVTAERDEWEQKANDLPDEVAETLNEYIQKDRQRTHKDKWGELVGKDLVEGANVEQLWKLTGYEPDADEIDEKALTEQVKKVRATAPFLFRTPADSAGNESPGGTNGHANPDGTNGQTNGRQPVQPPLNNGLDNGRGAPAYGSQARTIRVRESDLANLDVMKGIRAQAEETGAEIVPVPG